MQLSLELKDLAYIAVNIVSVTAIVLSFRNSLKDFSDFKTLVSSVLFQRDATLNVINQQMCKGHRLTIHEAIQRETDGNKKAQKSIDIANANIIKIAIHMGLEIGEQK